MRERTVGLPVTILVGGEFSEGGGWISPAEREQIRHKILVNASKNFGGVTITDTQGAWVDDNGRMVEERGFQVVVYVRDVTDRAVSEFAHFVRTTSRQTAVLVNIGGPRGAFLVSDEHLYGDAIDAMYGAEHA